MGASCLGSARELETILLSRVFKVPEQSGWTLHRLFEGGFVQGALSLAHSVTVSISWGNEVEEEGVSTEGVCKSIKYPSRQFKDWVATSNSIRGQSSSKSSLTRFPFGTLFVL